MKGRHCNLPLPHGRHLILHQRDERGNHQGQPWQESRRELVAQGFSLSRRHDGQGIAPGQHDADDLLLARTKRRKAELFLKLSSQRFHGEAELKGWNGKHIDALEV